MKTGEVPTSCAGKDRLLAFDTPLQLGARQVHFDQGEGARYLIQLLLQSCHMNLIPYAHPIPTLCLHLVETLNVSLDSPITRLLQWQPFSSSNFINRIWGTED